jgi:hypothetical protein
MAQPWPEHVNVESLRESAEREHSETPAAPAAAAAAVAAATVAVPVRAPLVAADGVAGSHRRRGRNDPPAADAGAGQPAPQAPANSADTASSNN